MTDGSAAAAATGQGIGASVLRKEDARFLHGRGNYVSDMMLPGQSEVALLRSPVAHGRIKAITKPAGHESAGGDSAGGGEEGAAAQVHGVVPPGRGHGSTGCRP